MVSLGPRCAAMIPETGQIIHLWSTRVPKMAQHWEYIMFWALSGTLKGCKKDLKTCVRASQVVWGHCCEQFRAAHSLLWLHFALNPPPSTTKTALSGIQNNVKQNSNITDTSPTTPHVSTTPGTVTALTSSNLDPADMTRYTIGCSRSPCGCGEALARLVQGKVGKTRLAAISD